MNFGELAVITGASSGIGSEIAYSLALRGFDVVICAENDRVFRIADDLRKTGCEVHPVQADLSTIEGCDLLLNHIAALSGHVEVLALNTGFGNGGRFVETDLDSDIQLVELNVSSNIYLAKKIISGMVLRGHGKVLFASSLAMTLPGTYHATYSASKSFIQAFSEALRQEVEDAGVTVRSVIPGPVSPQFVETHGSTTQIYDPRKDDPADVAERAVEMLLAERRLSDLPDDTEIILPDRTGDRSGPGLPDYLKYEV